MSLGRQTCVVSAHAAAASLALGYPVELHRHPSGAVHFYVVPDERPTRRLATRGGIWDRLRTRFFDRAALASAEKELATCVRAMRVSGLDTMLVAPTALVPQPDPMTALR